MGRAAVMEERGSLVTPARSLTEQIKNNLKNHYGVAPFNVLWLWVSRSHHIPPRHPKGQFCGAGGAWEPCSTCVSMNPIARTCARFFT